MKYLSLLFVVLFSFFNAQNQRFSYDYKFANNGNHLDKFKNEMMVLDVTSEGSHFYSYDKKRSDSIMCVMIEKQMKSSGGAININKAVKKGIVNYEIKKYYPDYKVMFIDYFGGYTYRVNDTRKMDWKISPEAQKIGEWNCQKATTEFAGRKWEVWFTPSIPSNDVPYKFHGLPGLIVKAQCEDATRQFLLVGVKKLPKSVEVSNGFSVLSRRKIVTLSLNKYVKQKRKHVENPTSNMRQMMSSGGVKLITVNGKKLSNAEMLRMLEKNQKLNLIEKDFSN